MKRKSIIISAIVSSCILSIATNSSYAVERDRTYTDDKNKPTMDGTNRGYTENTTRPAGGYRCASGKWGENGMVNPNEANSTFMSESNVAGARALKTDSIEDFKGSIKSISRVQYPDGAIIQVIVSTERGDMKVLLGPAQFVDQEKVKLESGDKIVIKGYRIMVNGEEVIMAQQIDKNGNILRLRDEQRRPIWDRGHGMMPSNAPSTMDSQRMNPRSY